MSQGQKTGAAVAVLVIVVGILGYVVWNTFAGEDVPANTRRVMCSETGELFPEEVQPGLGPYPHVNPKTEQRTLYPIEWCYKGECLEKGGTPVILNNWLGKEDPTRCPTCGAVVRFHNPGPPAGVGSNE